MIVLTVLIGFAIGSLPTAGWVAGLSGIDLRAGGSGNPGANNARNLGGMKLAATVLILELIKGVGAVSIGVWLMGDLGGAAAGVAAIGGNILNPWYRFSGGQGLGITAGVLLGAWPTWLAPVLATIAVVAYVTRSAPKAALTALAAVSLGLVVFATTEFPDAWGLDLPALVLLTAGVVALVSPKQIRSLRADD